MVDMTSEIGRTSPEVKGSGIEQQVMRDTSSSERWKVAVSDKQAILFMMATILLSPVIYDLVELTK